MRVTRLAVSISIEVFFISLLNPDVALFLGIIAFTTYFLLWGKLIRYLRATNREVTVSNKVRVLDIIIIGMPVVYSALINIGYFVNI